MLSLVRGGTRGMFLRYRDESVLGALSGEFPMEEKHYKDALDHSDEGQTLIFVSSRAGHLADSKVFLADVGPTEILVFLLNGKHCDKVEEVRALPRTILFRVDGDFPEIIEQMRQDYDGKVGRIPFFLRWGDAGDWVAVLFTRNNLNRPIDMKDLYPDVLYVKMPYEKLFRSLRGRAMSYFNEARGYADWKNLEIRVYDVWERYPLQARRLRLVLDELEIGLVLGEGRGKDYARILMQLIIYRFQLATFLEPEQVKGMLMGLEYGASGKRLVDLDLYEGKKKYSWGVRAEKGEDRAKAGVRFRESLMEGLLPSTREELAKIEEELEGLER